jgi:hypothetical protein
MAGATGRDLLRLKQDLVAVLDEHGMEYTSFTITDSPKRRHGQIQFGEVIEGEKQERMKLAVSTDGQTSLE